MNYHNLTYPDMNNGSGLRVVLWLSGCSHKCRGCQNPQTQDANSGIQFDESAKEELFRELDKDYISGLTLTGGDPFFENNLDGVLDLVIEVNKRYNMPQHIDKNTEENYNILNKNANEIRLSSPKKSIWLYTGYTWDEIKENSFSDMYEKVYQYKFENCDIKKLSREYTDMEKRWEIIKKCDVIIDGKYIESQRDITLRWRGSRNQRVIDVQKSLQKNEVVLWCD